MGASAIKELLSRIDLDEEAKVLREKLLDQVAKDSKKSRQEAHQAAGDHRGLQGFGQQARMDDTRRGPGHPARAAPHGPAGRRTVRHLGPQRPLPARHQPEQPPQEAPDAPRPRNHRAQRKAHAPGSRGRALRQQPPQARRQGQGKPPAEIALRHAQRKAGTLPPEPPGQARRLLGPLRHRHRSRSETAPVRTPEEDGRSSSSSPSS